MSSTLVEHLNFTLMTTMIKLPRFLQLHKKRIKIFAEKNHVCTTYCSNILYSGTNWVSDLHVPNNKHLGNCEEELSKNLSADCRSSVGRLSAVCWPTDGRQVFPKT